MGASILPHPEPRRVSAAKALQVRLLGGFEVTHAGETVSLPRSAQRLVAFLALQDGPLARTYVAAVLWPDTPERQAQANLRTALWVLRRSGCALVQSVGRSLQVAPEATVDVRELMGFCSSPPYNPSGFAEANSEPVIPRGDLLPDWDEEWILMERERISQRKGHRFEALCEQLSESGRFSEAVEAGLDAVSADPLRESAHRALIKTYLAEGNPAKAVHHYQLYRRLLSDQLNVEPSSQMETLMAALVR